MGKWEEVDIASVWALLWTLTGERSKFMRFQTLLLQFPKVHEMLRENNTAAIEDQISGFDAAKVERLSLVFAYLNLSNAERVVRGAIEWIATDINPKVVDKLERLDNIEAEAVSEEAFRMIFKVVKEKMGKEDELAALLFFAPLGPSVVQFVAESREFVRGKIVELLGSDVEMRRIVGCILCERLSEAFEQQSLVSPKLFELLSGLLVVKSEGQYRAHKAMRRLIECGVFDDRGMVQTLVDQFEKYDDKDRKLFFKLMLKFFNDVEMVVIEVVIPIVGFVITSFVNECGFRNELLGMLSAFPLPKQTVEQIRESALASCHSVFEKRQVEFYPDALAVLYGISNTDGYKCVISAAKDLLVAAQFMGDASGAMKTRIRCAQLLADLCDNEEARDNEDLQVKIPKLIQEFLCQTVGSLQPCNLVFLLSTVFVNHLNVLKAMSAADWAKVFAGFKLLVQKDTLTTRVNVELEVIKKISDHIDAALKAEFIETILKGDFEYLSGLPLSAIDGDSMLLHFIGSYIKKSESGCETICASLAGLLPVTTQTMLPSLLEPLMFALLEGKFTEEIAKCVVDGLVDVLPTLDMSERASPDSVMATFDVLSHIIQKYPAVNVDGVLANTKALLEKEEYKDNGMASIPFGASVNIICQILNAKNTCDKDLIIEFIEQMPLDAEELNAQIIASLIAMSDKEAFTEVHVPIVTLFVEMLVNKDQASTLSKEQTDQMKAVVKKAITADSKLERQITREFPRNLQNRFSKLFH